MANHNDYCLICEYKLRALDCHNDYCGDCCDNLDCPAHGEELSANLPDCDKYPGKLKSLIGIEFAGCCYYCGEELCDECYGENWATCDACKVDRCFDCHDICPEHD